MINKCMFIGNMGADPELRYMPNGDAASTVSIGCSKRWKDKQTGELRERTEWIRCVLFKHKAEYVCGYAHKGSKLYVEGEMRTRTYEDGIGVKKYVTEIYVDEVKILDKREEASGRPAPQSRPAQSRPAPQQQGDQGGFDDFDDDIPF